jgi:poly(hydroxyalkanoate) granule-associated protein
MNKTTKTENNDDEMLSSSEKVQKHKMRTRSKSGLDFRKYTKQIWLAGLGAFSRAEEEGNKLFDSLVKVGEELELKTSEIADQTVEKVSEKAKESVVDTKDKVERLIDHSVHHSLNRIGLITAKDIQHLENLILQLHSKVDALIIENEQLKAKIEKK